MTRTEKIAGLPSAIHEELNRRLDDGEPGVNLVEWLNGLAEVKAVIDADFRREPVSESNLTRWKRGGFLDWQARQKVEGMMERWVLIAEWGVAASVHQIAPDCAYV